MKNTKPKLGDVIEVETSKGYAYAQITNKHRDLGILIHVLNKIHPSSVPAEGFPELVNSESRYCTFIFKQDLYESPLVSVKGNADIPEKHKAFPMMRAGIKDPRTRQVACWWLWDGINEWPIGQLDESQRNLSIREIWNFEILIRRIESEWSPLDDV
jgi:hypothetical protein